MVATPTIAQHVAVKGGPPEYVDKNGPLLVGAAQGLVELPIIRRKATSTCVPVRSAASNTLTVLIAVAFRS